MPKVRYKKRILKGARRKQLVTYKRAPIRPAADFSKGTLQDRRAWHKTFKVLKTQYLQSGIVYLAKLSFRVEGQI